MFYYLHIAATRFDTYRGIMYTQLTILPLCDHARFYIGHI